MTNPEWGPVDPDSQEPQFVWKGVLNINMVSFSAMTFTCTGNFLGDLGLAWPVRLEQNVTNNTDKPWTDFHLALGPTGNRFYKASAWPANWNPYKANYTCDFSIVDLDGNVTGEPILRHEVFVDAVYIKAKTDVNGNGTFTLTKNPTYVPEAGTAAVLLSGGLGVLSYRIRRRKS